MKSEGAHETRPEMRKTRATSSTASSASTAKRRPSSASTVSPDHTLLVRKSSVTPIAPPTLPSRPSSSKYLVGQPSYRSLQEQFATLTRTNKATEEGARAALDRIAELERENFSLNERVATLEDWNATQAHTSAEAAVASESALARCQAENVLLAKLAAAADVDLAKARAAVRAAERAAAAAAERHAAEAATAAADAAAERGAAEAAAENREAAHEKAVRQLITEATERIEDEKTALRRQLREQEAANEVRAAAAADHHRLLLQGVRRDAEEAVKARDAHHAEEASRLRAEAAEALEAQHHTHTTRLLEVQAEAEEKVASAHDGSRLKEAYEEARELERGARLAAREIALLRDELRHVEADAEAQRAAAARAGDELERLRESAEVAGVTRREERARVEERRSAELRKELERTRLLLGLAQKDAAVARRGGASAATPKEVAARTCSSSTAATGAAASARPAVAFGRAVPAPAPAPVAAAPATRPTPATRKTPQKPSWSTRPPLSWQLPGEMGAPPPPTFSLADVLADECFDAASPYRPAIPRAAAEEGTGGSYLDL